MAGTPFIHQVRDQALHVGYGAIAGLSVDPWWAAPIVAGAYGAIREGEQWGTLNTPSVWDSALDWTFVVIGSFVGLTIRQWAGY